MMGRLNIQVRGQLYVANLDAAVRKTTALELRTRGFHQVAASGSMSIRLIVAANPNSLPTCSARTIVAWQHTQHFWPSVSSGGRISTSSTSEPVSIFDLL